MSIKVAFIGAGSIGFCRRLFRDILAVPELHDTRFALHDINGRNLDMVARLCQKDIRVNRLAATVTTHINRRQALEDADYVVNCTRIGGLEAFKTDIDIPLKYGVDQCVGDTLCIGGIMYGQRNIPCILDFCKDIRQVAKSDCLFLNYANPNAMNTWAAIEYGKVRTVGLCHGVEGGWRQIASAIMGDGDRRYGPGVQAWVREARERIHIICAGINHQTWYTQILFDGRKVSGKELLAAFERHPKFPQTEKVRIDVLRRFGYYSTESNGHLSEYLPWYRKRPRDIRKWIDLSSWINGETGGYLRVCTEGRNWFRTDYPNWLKAEDKPIGPDDRSHEHGSWIIEALETGRVYRGHFNVRNNGCISNLPEDCIVEVPGYVDANGMSIPIVGDLPLACAATLSASVNVQRMSVRAAVEADVTLLKQAVLHDPLTGAVCDPEEIWQMVDEMLIAQAKWLPQYARQIPAAKRRLAEVKRRRLYRGTNKSKGAARIRTKTIGEMKKRAEETRRQAAADKAADKRAQDAKVKGRKQ
ncbi:MAG: alpha-glucosidase/alpha-galactosidase [Planctomycetes bacterium]|nr:alpha-glucosidase/alpha-galactosidase [Planctomycetota bacterium]